MISVAVNLCKRCGTTVGSGGEPNQVVARVRVQCYKVCIVRVWGFLHWLKDFFLQTYHGVVFPLLAKYSSLEKKEGFIQLPCECEVNPNKMLIVYPDAMGFWFLPAVVWKEKNLQTKQSFLSKAHLYCQVASCSFFFIILKLCCPVSDQLNEAPLFSMSEKIGTLDDTSFTGTSP